MNDDYTPTTEQVREAYHDSLNRDRSRAAFDRFLAAHDAALLAAQPAPAFKTGWVNGENYIASNAAHPATAIDRETLLGWIVVDKTTRALDWDGELHFSKDRAMASLLENVKFQDDGWQPFELYDICPVYLPDALLASGVLNEQTQANARLTKGKSND